MEWIERRENRGQRWRRGGGQRWVGRSEVEQVVVVVVAEAGGWYGLGFGRLKKGFKFGHLGVMV